MHRGLARDDFSRHHCEGLIHALTVNPGAILVACNSSRPQDALIMDVATLQPVHHMVVGGICTVGGLVVLFCMGRCDVVSLGCAATSVFLATIFR